MQQYDPRLRHSRQIVFLATSSCRNVTVGLSLLRHRRGSDLHCVPIKPSTFYFFEHFSQKSANFTTFHMVDTFNNFCNFAYLKFHLACDETSGYLKCIQSLREAMKI